MKTLFQSKVPAKDRVPFWQKVAYGLGGPVEGTAVWIPQQNLTPIFNIGLGMSPVLIGIILMIWRCWDAFADPIMGNFSDNARTRWGRRRPFIVLGAVLTGFTLPLMWWVPTGLSEWGLFAWLLGFGLVFYTCFTVWAMPYYSLQLEMTPDYDERTNITSYRAYAQQILALFAGWILACAALPIFGTLPNGDPDIANGMRYISIGLAVLTVILGSLPGLFVKERYYKEGNHQPKQELLPSLKQTLSTRPFLWVVALVFMYTFGFGLVNALGFYVNAYDVCRGDVGLAAKIQGVKSTLLFAPNLIAIPVCTWISMRFGKKLLLYAIAICGIIGKLSIYLFYTPENPWLQLIPPLLLSPVNMGLWLIVPAMQADVADYDELVTGQRREGSFSAVFSWTTKVSATITSGVSGLILVWTGFNIDLGAAQTPATLGNLKTFYIWIPVAFLCFCIMAIRRYDLSRERMEAIRSELEARRGAI